LDENKIDKDYLKSEDFLSFVELLFKQVISEAKGKKREMCQSALKNASLIKFKEFDKELLLNLLINAPLFYLQLLKDCKKVAGSGDTIYLSKLYKIREDFKPQEGKRLINHLFYLSSLGLLNREINVNVDGTAQEGYLNADAETENLFTITGLAKDLLCFIESNN